MPVLLMMVGFTTHAAQINVLTAANGSVGSLRQAVLSANAGDTVVFNTATNGNTILLTTGEIVINKSLVIMGNGSANTIISGNNNSRIFNITNAGNVTISNVLITNGNALLNGGAINISSSTVTITASEVSNSSALLNGGGIYNTGTLTLTSTVMRYNSAAGVTAASGGGAIFNDGGTLDISSNSIIRGNTATGISGSGGAVFSSSGTVTVNMSRLDSNAANRAGGAIEVVNGSFTITDCNISDNDVNGGAGTANPGNGGALHVTGNTALVTVSNSTVSKNEAASEGGGLWNQAGSTMIIDSVSMNSSTISANIAAGAAADNGGGGVFNNGGTVIIKSTTISNNRAIGTSGSGGGIFSTAGNITIENSRINLNAANRAGGAIEIIDDSLTITSTMMSDNDVSGTSGSPNPGNGGAIHVTGNTGTYVLLNNSTVTGNEAGREGGGLWNQAGSIMYLESNTIVRGNTALGNSADDGGGGIFNNGGTMSIENSTIVSNRATGTSASGGGILTTDGTITINNTTIDSNSANRAGGAIEIIDGTLNITASNMSNNDVNGNAGAANPGNGGALHVTGSSGTTVTISNTVVANNEAGREGGGLWNQSGSTMNVDTRSTIEGNLAAGTAFDDGGGGIFNNGGTLNVSTTTISNNRVSTGLGTGGGVFNHNGGTTMLSYSTISGNRADAGGGIRNDGTMTINANTITNNTAATNGGGIAQLNTSNTLTIKGSIVAGNTATAGGGTDVFSSSGTTNSGGYNLFGEDDMNHVTAVATDIEGTTSAPVDAGLNVLADNGGGVETHSLKQSSPAIDMGDPADNSNDQRDSAVFNGKRDMGAFESKLYPDFINDVVAAQLSSVAPNPSVNGTVRITIPERMKVNTLRVVEMATGKVVYEQAINGTTTLNLRQPAGNYLLQISGADVTETHKLVVVK